MKHIRAVVKPIPGASEQPVTVAGYSATGTKLGDAVSVMAATCKEVTEALRRQMNEVGQEIQKEVTAALGK